MNDYELYHHGILGMKWGVRRYQNADGSLTAAGRKRYDVDEAKERVSNAKKNRNAAFKKYYTSYGYNVKPAHKKLKEANAQLKEAKKDLSYAKKSAKTDRKEKLSTVDPELAKNKQTKRVAYDYHNLTNDAFRRKYKTTKKKFQKRYVKYDGDTYTAGKKKAARAAFIVANSSDVSYYDLRSRQFKTIQMGKAAAAKSLAMDIGYAEAAARIGYNKAEQEYRERHK